MKFANPSYLWTLFGIILFVIFLWWSLKRRRTLLSRFAQHQVAGLLARNHSYGWMIAKSIMLVVAVMAAIFAAARPQWNYEDRRIISRGIDMIVAVDTSNSMLAQDYKPSRLERAKQLLQNILWSMKGDRLGIMAFAGNAYMKCPLTLDYAMARTALDSLDVNAVPTQGTAIGGAIDTAVSAFKTSSQGQRVLVLLTDGEDQGSKPIEAAERAKAAGVRIYTIGIGTTQGMPIPLPDGNYKQDKSGKTINSRLDFLALEKIAQITGGKAIKANTAGTAELEPIMSDLSVMQKTEHQDKTYRVYTERFQWFLVSAIILLAWEALETAHSRRRQAWKGRVSKS
ncbi:MAG: VWA domain-containing protein [bacterium]|nr:VWA domain-containing protein [Candidatus Sumerlaeota bacterium]